MMRTGSRSARASTTARGAAAQRGGLRLHAAYVETAASEAWLEMRQDVLRGQVDMLTVMACAALVGRCASWPAGMTGGRGSWRRCCRWRWIWRAGVNSIAPHDSGERLARHPFHPHVDYRYSRRALDPFNGDTVEGEAVCSALDLSRFGVWICD